VNTVPAIWPVLLMEPAARPRRHREGSAAANLAAFPEQGGAKAAAARALHVERRTLYFRIARIEKLLGRSLSDREVQLRCHLAIRGLDLLKLRSPSTGLPRREGTWEATQRPEGGLITNTEPGGTEPPGESARSHACDDRS
jgi:hypothetical protein